MNTESKRQKALARQVQKDLSDIFQKNASLFSNQLITITQVSVTADLGVAKVYLSFLNTKETSYLMGLMEENNTFLRQELAHKLRHQVRRIPELRFYVDNTEEEAKRIESLIKNLNIPPASEQDDFGNTYREE